MSHLDRCITESIPTVQPRIGARNASVSSFLDETDDDREPEALFVGLAYVILIYGAAALGIWAGLVAL